MTDEMEVQMEKAIDSSEEREEKRELTSAERRELLRQLRMARDKIKSLEERRDSIDSALNRVREREAFLMQELGEG